LAPGNIGKNEIGMKWPSLIKKLKNYVLREKTVWIGCNDSWNQF